MSLSLPLPSRRFVAWFAAVGLIYVVATAAMAVQGDGRVDVPMRLAVQLLRGEVALPDPPPVLDAVTREGRAYHVIGLGVVLPDLLFAPFPALWPWSRWVLTLSFGLLAAGLAWPLADRYGPGGRTTVWLATLTALGTLLLPMANQGNFYYLAHVIAMAFVFAALIELRGRRRAWLVGGALALACLARPTLLLAAIPIGLFLVWSADRRRLATMLAFSVPVGLTVLVMGAYNWARFGSPLETGYGLAILTSNRLSEARAAGVFSLAHLGDNVATLLAKGFDVRPRLPFLVPPPDGHSILLTTPAVITAVNAGWRDPLVRTLWACTVLVLVPLLLYYGGAGFRTYGYRYLLDVMPFVLALVAVGARAHFARTERALVVLSIGFCLYGVAWGISQGQY